MSYIILTIIKNKYNYRHLLEEQTIETLWTITPAVTLIFIALPSLHTLYLLDELLNPTISIKTIGHQWYWSYEYSDFKNIEFDSFIEPTTILKIQEFRLLDTDNRITIPFKSQIRLIVTARDVIHSWTIPSIAIKIDATPGRLNQASITSSQTGLTFGQCSEICGINHRFIPITIERISPKFFIKWIKSTNKSLDDWKQVLVS